MVECYYMKETVWMVGLLTLTMIAVGFFQIKILMELKKLEDNRNIKNKEYKKFKKDKKC